MSSLSILPLRFHATLQIERKDGRPIRFMLWCDDLSWEREAIKEAERLLGFRVERSSWAPRPLLGYATELSAAAA